MALLEVRKEYLVVSSGSKFIAVKTEEIREPFVYDCTKAENKPEESGNKGDEVGAEEKGSDRILAMAFSASGEYFALTDDSKRLVLFRTKPVWECLSTRWVVRRCTSLTMTKAEDQILVADKSGDVYSFSLLEPQKPAELKLGHLSMLLAVAISPDDRYIITADRDEKIRVSFLKSPYNIQSFCLGHKEFVSSLFVLPYQPYWLLSGSGDGTLRLWEFEFGKELQSYDLRELNGTKSPQKDKKFAVSRIASSPQGDYIAVLCDSFPTVHIFRVDFNAQRLMHQEQLDLAHSSWDVAFDQLGRLWVLQQSKDCPVALYRLTGDCWKCDTEDPEVKKVTKILHSQWDMFQESVGDDIRYHNLYKANFDNMAAYLQKKQERLQQQGKKRPGAHPESNGSNKKPRAEQTTS